MEYLNTITTGSSTNYGYATNGAVYLTPSAGTTWTTSPAPRPPPPLEWLDGEIERTCALARAAK